MIRVMLVDDQRLARLGFQLMLDDVTDITVITSAENGQSAIDTLNQLDANHRPLPDVILMDVRMPGMDGIEATRHIARHWPTIRTLILTTYDEDDYAFGGLDAGASGFLLKDISKSQLMESIKAVFENGKILTPRITKKLVEYQQSKFIFQDQQNIFIESFKSLTTRERDICALIAQGLSNEDIAKKLFLETKSVKRYVSRILSKLHLSNRTQIAINWIKSGVFTQLK
ncbi:DNA-binding response regulator [Bifidobacterium sp. DSM 109958]|uniref:Two component transcriptional regulator, LuxR family n=5 Tax=Bifidobacterium TaxID=1678 RepID=A0A087CTL8_9BIFI|nr:MULTISPECIES: response regulator transcription factor [Bifidobacterium]KFI56219.1 two component transcriptional regulator, LuxR family [Bifidobacterium callitrichos DSM 23973]KFI86618.1 two component transcriptional regulator, LuxR family [Bifidobacterium reuteri DSM 23975]MBT1179019.1 response regulator transcription factor [Bifidobacterium vespertilionis]NMN00700.1 DNA-binding response regulator [Bifidobacterium sp. DSM 109958]PLS29725.1 DNA-binding response regulator [Bifidobacterium par